MSELQGMAWASKDSAVTLRAGLALMRKAFKVSKLTERDYDDDD